MPAAVDHERVTNSLPQQRRRTVLWIIGAVVVLALIAGLWWAFGRQTSPTADASASPTVVASPSATPSATPTPTPTGFPANTASYDLAGLPRVDVFAVIPALKPDDKPDGGFTGEQARASGVGAPVFADPAGEPVAYLPHEYTYGGTAVPIVERQEHWVKVLLSGRSAMPSAGDPGQLSGWLRAQDVVITENDAVVEVSIGARTIDIVQDETPERVADDFGWGVAETPTPLGRTFIMMVRADPSLGYTRGHPLVYLAVQSPTLDGFGGAAVAITAFHYHDAHSGAISNGCLRLGPEAIDRLAQLQPGTPVIIRA